MSELYVHYVCIRQEARAILAGLGQDRFWVSNCGCRESRGHCARSRMDVCLDFRPVNASGGSGLREVSRAEVDEILAEAEAKHLVMRPFRDAGVGATVGFCVCCDDCCGYFLDAEERCAKGACIESTDQALCTDCGDCSQVCYFGARRMEDGRLALDRDECYGCGLCLDVCPAGCIEMVGREPHDQG